MSKFLRNSFLILLLVLLGVGPVLADTNPSQLESPNYVIQSIFFGATGTVYSYSASVPPVITVQPTVINITQNQATIVWSTDKASSSVVLLGATPGTYANQYGSADTTLETAHSVVVDRLTRGTTYYFKVRSVDADGDTVESAEYNFQTDPGDIIPPVITVGPSISIDSASLVTITWQTNELASSVVQYGVKDVTENAVGPADDLTLFHQIHVSGLTPAQSYSWRVKTTDASGNITYSPTQILATPNSPFISGFSITDITLTSAVVQWTTSTSSTTVVEMGTQSSVYAKKITDETYSTSHILRLSDLASGTTYYLKVSGVDQAGNLLQSDEKIFATVVVPQITDLTITNIKSDSATVTWTSSSPVDEFLKYQITKNDDPALVHKNYSGGNDKLVTTHTFQLADLESSSTYTLSVLGKDVFGNQAISNELTFVTPIDRTPPNIMNIKSDTTIDLGSQQTVQILVSCEIDKLAKIVIEYGTGASGPYDKKITTDDTYSRAKFLVISGLEPGQTYHYHLVATDKAGNVTVSASILGLAPKQRKSLLNLIGDQFLGVFGWLGNL